MLSILMTVKMASPAEGGFLEKLLNEWSTDGQEFIHTTLPRLIVIALIAFLLSRLLRVITHRMIRVAEQHAVGAGQLAQVKTLAGVIRATGLTVIGLIAGMQALDALGFDLAPLLASAGIAGVAIGLAAQNIVKDMFNGILILVEGQFNVGDAVIIAGVSGNIEAMTLRKTSVRGYDGTLYIIPNSQITTVANQNVGFSVATVNVSVDYSADPNKVMDLLKGIAMSIRNSDQFRQLFVDDPQVLGMDAIKGSEIIFPVVFKTQATKQYGPIREFRRRVRLALEEHHLLPGDPYRVFQSFGDPVPAGRGQAAAEAAPKADPTLLKPQETNPFTGE
ncbi:MAG: mechanosensitive ion channel family protein [Acidobacteriota bacterium]|jgi:small conductance mechanosensitive channel